MREFRSYHSIFDTEYHKQKHNWEADIRNWEIQRDINIPWIFYVKDSSGVMTQTTCVDCSCDDYIESKTSSCMHISALLRARYDSVCHSLFRIEDGIYYNAESDCLTWKQKRKTQRIHSRNELNTICDKNDSVVITEGAKRKIYGWENESIYKTEIIAKKQSIKLDEFANTFQNEGIKLHQYQVDAAIHMLIHPRCVLALPMGYGKTLTALACIKHIETTEKRSLKVLVCCPTSLKMQWRQEVNKYLKTKTTMICTGSKPAQIDMVDFIVVNYESIYRVPGLLEQSYDLLILDEVQKIKNKETKAWKSVKLVKARMCYALSGTVVENSVEDFVSVMEVIDESSIRPKWRFVNEFCDYTKLRINNIKPQKIVDLKARYSNYIIKCNVPKSLAPTSSISEQKQSVAVSIDAAQQSSSNDFFGQANRLLAISQQRPLTFAEKIMLNAYLTKARMAANDLRLIDKSLPKSNKTKEIADTIIKHTSLGQKVVVYSQWIEYLNLIAEELNSYSVEYVHYNGSFSIQKKNRQLGLFQKNSSTMVFLSTDTGGLGLDGLQLVSNVVINCESMWNPAKIAQRNGRLIRIGQTKKVVYVYNFYSKNTIEDQFILQNNSRKDTIRESIIE